RFDYEYFPGVGYYKLFTSGENWVGAHKRCTLDGAHLAVINSETEAEVFRQLLARFPTLNNTDHDHRALVGFHAIYDTTSPDDCKKFYTVHDAIARFTHKPVALCLLQVQQHYYIAVTEARGPDKNKTPHEKRYMVTS
ncbi:unnamed protein product, partial [Timema podura]|nr:unnamed protein product [Timema podura]